jgi:hypothetical protein
VATAHADAVHVAVALASTQRLPHAPQLLASLRRSTSQPSVTEPLQLP